MVKVMVRDQCVKGLKWYHGMDVVYLRLSNWTCMPWILHS